VTNAKYASFLKASNYVPSDRMNWLKHSFNFPPGAITPSGVKEGWEDKPVTYVSLRDAEAYCKFYDKRLPSAIEWQYVAQGGNSSMIYPWGTTDNANFTPAVNNDWVNPGPEPVGTHPEGAINGVHDLVRSVWQMTSVFEDSHTRSIILRGGSNYNPWRGKECRWISNDDGTPRAIPPACFATAEKTSVPGSKPHVMGGSHWYFPPAYRNDQYNKYFLMGGSYERAGTVSFRCVADAQDDCGNGRQLCVDIAPLDEGVDVNLDAMRDGIKPMDWIHFTRVGETVPVRMQFDVPRTEKNSITVGIDATSTTKGVTLPNGTSFSWTHGTDGPTHGNRDLGGIIAGTSLDGSAVGGISFEAPGTLGIRTDNVTDTNTNCTAVATVFLGPSLQGACGTRVTATSNGFTKEVDVDPVGGIVTIAYKASLAVQLMSNNGKAPCARSDVLRDGACIGQTTLVNDQKIPIDLSAVSILDWSHYGGIGKNGVAPPNWNVDKMIHPSTPSSTGARILAPTCTTKVGSTIQNCSLVKLYNKAAAMYSWSDGTPTKENEGAGGVFSAIASGVGGFSLEVQGQKEEHAVQRLKFYVGAYDTAAKIVVVSSTGGGQQVSSSVKHASGTRNFVWTIDFIGNIKVSWLKDNDVDGNLTLQAATLEDVSTTEGTVLQSIVLHRSTTDA
jgi:formylglycine-generating enzyme required for sulfatase activity